MIKLLTLFLLIFIGTMALAQSVETFSISGNAVSKYSGMPIRGSSVIIAKNKGTTSNKAGEFLISGVHQGKYKLSFYSFDYKRKDTVITLEGKSIRDLVLSIPVDYKNFNNKKVIKDTKRKIAILFVNWRESKQDLNADKLFQTKYDIRLKYDGFEVATEHCMRIYNRAVIGYLDEVYGEKWRDDLQGSIYGLR
ncbi:MAG: carboxypeptidase-like regulatory domain-containing protein [Ginsengibacter sp.]